MLTVNPATITEELQAARKILDKWVERMNAGLPTIDHPGSEEQLELLMREFCGELKICAGKCATLSEVLLGD